MVSRQPNMSFALDAMFLGLLLLSLGQTQRTKSLYNQ